mgnify:CR=1 FL=1
MILTRGCASRLLILSANRNLRALLSGLVFAVTVQATMAGWLAPVLNYDVVSAAAEKQNAA